MLKLNIFVIFYKSKLCNSLYGNYNSYNSNYGNRLEKHGLIRTFTLRQRLERF